MRRSTRRALKRILGSLIFLGVLYLVASPFLVPMLAQRFVRDFDDEISVRFGWALFNPVTLDLIIDDLVLVGPEKTVLVRIPSARLPLDVGDLLAGTGTFNSDFLNASWRTEGEQVVIVLSEIALAFVAPFGETLDIKIDSGRFNAKLTVPSEEGPITGGVSIMGLQARSTDIQMSLSLENLTIDSFAFDPDAQTLTTGDVIITSVQAKSPDNPVVLNVEALTLGSVAFDATANSLNIERVIVTAPVVDNAPVPAPGLIARSRAERRSVELQIQVDGIDVVDGKINLLGHSLDAMLAQITTPTMALRNLRYGADWSGMIEAAGMVNTGDTESPFTLNAQVDSGQAATGQIKLVVDRLDHTLLSPGLFSLLGRGSAAGTLYADLDANSAEGELDGVLSLVFDQWEWGDINPDYAGEPISLRKAFNLLRGRGGRVRMDLPLEGNLDEPTFRGDAVVRRATNRAIGDIVGAPFKLLGALIPGGGKSDLELNKIKFEPGSAELTPLDRSKLSALAAALLERPGLKLSIEGAASAGIDFPEKTGVGDDVIALAGARADAIKTYLIVAGVDDSRLSASTSSATSKNGGGKPIVNLAIMP